MTPHEVDSVKHQLGESILKQIKQNGTEKNFEDLLFDNLTRQRLEEVNTRLIANGVAIQGLFELLNEINLYYTTHGDSRLIATQKDLPNYKQICDLQKKQNDLFTKAREDFEQIDEGQIVGNAGSSTNSSNSLHEAILKACESYNKYLKDPSFNAVIKRVDILCIDYIQLLNLIQMKYAYGIDYNLNNELLDD